MRSHCYKQIAPSHVGDCNLSLDHLSHVLTTSQLCSHLYFKLASSGLITQIIRSEQAHAAVVLFSVYWWVIDWFQLGFISPHRVQTVLALSPLPPHQIRTVSQPLPRHPPAQEVMMDWGIAPASLSIILKAPLVSLSGKHSIVQNVISTP